MQQYLRHTQTPVKGLFACGAMEPDCVPCKIGSMSPRLAEIRENQRLRLEGIADELGVAISTVSRWESGDTNIPTKRFAEIAKAYNCAPSDIFRDADEPVVGHRLPILVAPDRQPTISIDSGEVVAITQLDLSLPMGPGALVDDYVEDENVLFDLAYIRAFTRTPPARLRLARGAGDSMFPTLVPNDLVWVDTTQNQLLHADRIYAASINGGAAIKRLRPIAGGKRVLVISDNKAIDPYEVDADEVVIWGRVIRYARDL